jgi:hypothetical protein
MFWATAVSPKWAQADDIPVAPTPQQLESRIRVLRDALLAKSDRLYELKIDHQFSVQALIEIIKQESKPDGKRELVIAAYSELGNYPDVNRGVEFLVQSIDAVYIPIARANPLKSHPVALAVLRVGAPARTHLMAVGRPLSNTNLQLRAQILAKIEEYPVGDSDSGRSAAVARIMRHIDDVYLRPAVTEADEEAKRLAIKNLRCMISLLSDPTFDAASIPLDPANP